jgi:hypothetical protein
MRQLYEVREIQPEFAAPINNVLSVQIRKCHSGSVRTAGHCEVSLHILTEAQKAAKVSCAQEMIRVLDHQARTPFKYLLRGDESWVHCDQSPTKMLVLDPEFVDQRVRLTNYRRKT